jgi:hypothetical protein
MQVYGQGKFLDGYIISIKGDTLKGQIRYEAWDISPNFIDFSDKNGVVQKISSEDSKSFFVSQVNETYRSKKIGILNIDLNQFYTVAPSIIAKDSARTFLREIISGSNASLLEFINSAAESHFLLDKDSKLTELINYPFYRTINDKKYLIVYDDYKNQLSNLLSDSKNFKMSIPSYTENSLRKYIKRYNESLGEEEYSIKADKFESGSSIDFLLSVGIEGWTEPGVNLKNSISYGIGFRVNLARKFNNRYIKINAFLNPRVFTGEVYNYIPNEKISLKTIEIGTGTYIGTGKIRPFAGLDYGFPLDNWRSTSLSPHFGIGYRRQFNIEISHFANFTSIVSEIPFFNRPRITLNYSLNLNMLFKKK